MTLTDEEIRVKVAKLMGWVWHGDKYWDQEPDRFYWKLGNRVYQRLPDYLNDPLAALQLCDRMHSEGWSYTITRYPERPEHFVTFGKPEHEGFHAPDPSLARAVTLCFLKCHE